MIASTIRDKAHDRHVFIGPAGVCGFDGHTVWLEHVALSKSERDALAVELRPLHVRRFSNQRDMLAHAYDRWPLKIVERYMIEAERRKD